MTLIGSSCIKKFERGDMVEETLITEDMFKLLHAVENNRFIELSSELFSRKLLRALYDRGAFLPTKYNGCDGFNDYNFMLDMFNKRRISELQEKKVRAIILNSIRPYLQSELKNRVKR